MPRLAPKPLSLDERERQQLQQIINRHTSIADLKARILEFIDYFNRTMAKPFKWTYKGKALAA